MDISPMIWPTVDRKEIARVLDDVGDPVRLRTAMDLSRRELAALFDAAADNEPLALDDLVPPGVPPLTEVIHEGKNSLFLFTRFQKRFCRPPDNAIPELWGYNEQTFRFFTGPGYFVAYPTDGASLLIDYARVPPAKPEHWPEIISNRARLSRFVFYGTTDILRRVSHRVSIGRMYRGGKPRDTWFVLVRKDRPLSTTGSKALTH
jgi:hypothetical protein